jgi:hypothetical protein
MASLSHMVIAEHVGTSREIVRAQMSRLRGGGDPKLSAKLVLTDLG